MSCELPDARPDARAYGHAYVDRTQKVVEVLLIRRGVTKTKTTFAMNGADLTWEFNWLGPGAVRIVFYDLPDGVSIYDKGAAMLRHAVLTKIYRYDLATDVFLDQAHGASGVPR